MQAYFMESICKTGIFIICAQVLVHFRPKASYEKYLKMLVSAMILVQLFVPIGELFAESNEQNFAENVAQFEEELSKRLEQTGEVAEDVEEISEYQPESSAEASAADNVIEQNNRTILDIPIHEINMDKINIQIGEGGRRDADN